MSMITGWEIKYILLKFGELEWIRCGSVDFDDPVAIKHNKTDNFRTRPSFTAWRFKDPDPKVEQAILEAVKSFKGNVEWMITVKTEGNRNWVIKPKKLAQYQKEGKVDKAWGRVENYIAEHEPEFGIAANNDIPALAEHIELYVRNRLKML
jgi:hypothetical protein